MTQVTANLPIVNIKKNISKEFIYDKVDNEKRIELLRLLQEEHKTLKEASQILNINYSTAKTIIRVYRKENRIFKKSYLKDTTSNSNSGKKVISTLENSEGENIRKEEKEKSFDKAVFAPNNNNNFIIEHLSNPHTPNEKENEKNKTNSSAPDINKMLGRKINREIESCNKMLNDVYQQIIINRNMLQNLFFISNVIKKSSEYNMCNF